MRGQTNLRTGIRWVGGRTNKPTDGIRLINRHRRSEQAVAQGLASCSFNSHSLMSQTSLILKLDHRMWDMSPRFQFVLTAFRCCYFLVLLLCALFLPNISLLGVYSNSMHPFMITMHTFTDSF